MDAGEALPPLKVAIVAGETSGDTLGAALIEALRARVPRAQFRGVAGPRMRAAGCEALADAHELAVMGLVEVLRHLPRLLRLRRRLAGEILAWRPDVFIGVDAPEFNLGLGRRLKGHGLTAVQYVSPQVWAWRQGRVRTMARACDLVLCLLPFEPQFYREHAVRAQFVGHPLADQIPLQRAPAAARAALGIDAGAPLVALLPGSRHGEIERLGAAYVAAADWLAQQRPALRFIAPMANPAARAAFEPYARQAVHARIQLLDGQARTVLQAADAALVTSGTATLEALLCGCPMVVAYRVSALSARLLRTLKLVRLPYFSLPNLLAGEPLVPEFFQEQVQPQQLGAAVLDALENTIQNKQLKSKFDEIHLMLRQDGAARAAQAVLQLPGRKEERVQ